MIAKQFCYVCFGVLMLAVAFQLGVQTSRADFNPVGVVVGINGNGVLTANGTVWIANASGWEAIPADQAADPPVPVPLPEVKLWGNSVVVTHSDEVWVTTGVRGDNRWVNLGMPPGVVAVDNPTWGSL